MKQFTMRTTALVAALLLGCGGAKNKETARDGQSKGEPPEIDAVLDLGGAQATANGALNTAASDGRFTPGEWVAIEGEYLDDPSAAISIDGAPVVLEETAGGSLIARLPRTITPLSTMTISVTTTWGADTIEIHPQSYLVLSDTGEGAVRFFRTGDPAAEAPKLLETECGAISLERARFHAISRSGAFLYAVGGAKEHSGEAPVLRELLVIHLGAPNGPGLLQKTAFQSVERPTAMMLNPEGTYLVLTTQTELLVFDVQSEQAPTLISTTSLKHDALSEGGYDRAVLLDGGKRAALLDGLANRLTAVELSDPRAPSVIGHFDLLDDELPRIIDIAADPSRPGTVHVLEGPNFRLAKEMFHRFLPKLTAVLKSEHPERKIRLRSVVLENGTFRQTREIPLPPRTLPLHFSELSNGDVLIHAADFSVTELKEISGVAEGFMAVMNVLLAAVQVGAVLRVSPDGTISTVAQGVSLFLSTAEVPGRDELVSLVMRIAIKKFPPSVGVKLSVDTLNADGNRQAEIPLRAVEYSAILPPYDTPVLSFQ